jgi:DNA-directed RNA polymerase specialized sigma24 family protein
MEKSVVQISRYLNRRGVTAFSQDTSSLLMCAFCRALRRHVVKLRRVELAPDLSEASERPSTRSCTTEEDCRLDAEKAARQLSARGRQMYELRHAGFEWREIAQKLSTTDAAARAEFSRELKRARLKLKKKCPTKTDSRDRKDSTRQREFNSWFHRSRPRVFVGHWATTVVTVTGRAPVRRFRIYPSLRLFGITSICPETFGNWW